MLVKELFKINRFCILDDDAQVLEAGQRVLLGVQHLLGGLLHVPVRLLGEHPAAAAPAAAAAATSRRREWREWAGKRLARAAHSLPSLAGRSTADSSPVEARAATSTRLAPPLQGAFGSGSNMAAPLSGPRTERGRPGRAARPSCRRRRRRSPPAAAAHRHRPGPRTQGHGGRALGGGSAAPLSLRPP